MRLRHKLISIFVVAALTVAVGSLATWSVMRLRGATEWVVQTRTLIGAVDAVVADLASAESALRAYQATGDESYLSPLQDVPAALLRELALAERLVSGDRVQQRRVAELHARAAERLRSIEEAATRPAGSDAERAARVRRGTRQMTAVREAARVVRQGQEALLRRRVERERQLAAQALAVILVGSLASGFLIALIGRGIQREVAEQERAARRAERQAGRLATQHAELQRNNAQLHEQQRELREQAEVLTSAMDELRAANTELRQLRDQAEAARQAGERAVAEEARGRAMQSRFMAMTTHEIRQPINALLGFAQLLEMEVAGPLTEGQKAQVTRIVAGAQHLRTLVDDVLEYAKADAGELRVETMAAPTSEALRSAVELVTPQAASRNVTVEVVDASTCGRYRGDPQRVRQILVNLLSNAVKFTATGGVVALQCREQELAPAGAATADADRWIRFEVTDTGPGIPADQLDRVFEPYVQYEDGSSAKPGTTGLGLTVSRKLAHLMGGEITIWSEVGVGSTFTLWLPASSAVEAMVAPDAIA